MSFIISKRQTWRWKNLSKVYDWNNVVFMKFSKIQIFFSPKLRVYAKLLFTSKLKISLSRLFLFGDKSFKNHYVKIKKIHQTKVLLLKIVKFDFFHIANNICKSTCCCELLNKDFFYWFLEFHEKRVWLPENSLGSKTKLLSWTARFLIMCVFEFHEDPPRFLRWYRSANDRQEGSRWVWKILDGMMMILSDNCW